MSESLRQVCLCEECGVCVHMCVLCMRIKRREVDPEAPGKRFIKTSLFILTFCPLCYSVLLDLTTRLLVFPLFTETWASLPGRMRSCCLPFGQPIAPLDLFRP